MIRNEQVLCPNCQSDDVFSRGNTCICGNCGSRFQISKQNKQFQPLNLFLSYGHTEDQICRLISQALKNRGHTIWFDEDKLCQGQDWRKEIADAIKISNGVISCLSRHSVRNPGVCLNELSIAIGVRGGNIKTILLEPEKDVRPPASLCHIQWLDNPEGPRLCILYGDPGVGKSSFAANYIHYNPRVAAGLFCEYDRPVYNDAATVIMTLSYLLACRLPVYRTALVAVLEREKRLGMMNASELFDLLLTEPITTLTIDGGHETLCVVIDGLDECGRGEYNALAEVLARYIPRLPTWLRVLVTSREVAAVKAPLAGAFALELHGNSSQNLADIRQYFIEQLEESQGSDPAWERALNTLTDRSSGIFLYAHLVCEGILAGKISIHDADSFPDGLSKAFHQWFGWFFPDIEEYKADFRLPLGMLLAAPEPLPTEELKRIFGWDNNRLGDFLRRVEVLLRQDVDDFGKETVTFTHLYLNEWLDTGQAGRFRSDRAAALEHMAERFYAIFQKDAETLTEYESLHLATLLAQCGQVIALDEVLMSHDLLWNIIRAGSYCKNWGKIHSALGCFEQAQGMAEKMVKQNNASRSQRDLGDCYDRVASVLRDNGAMDMALKLFQKALSIAEQLVHECGTLDDFRDLSISYEKVANLLQDKGDLDRALELFQNALPIAEQLVRQRGNPDDRRNLSNVYQNTAGILYSKGNLSEASDLLQKALPIAEQLVQDRRTYEDLQDLSTSYMNISHIVWMKGNLEEALALAQKGMEIREQLVQERGTPSDCVNLSTSYNTVADILEDRGDLPRALELCQKGMEIAKQVVQQRGVPEDHRDLGISYNKVANILQAKGNLDGALELYQKGMEIREQLVRERGTPDDHRDLSVSYAHIADILEVPSDIAGALGLYQKGMEIAEQLVQERGAVSDYEGLATTYNRLAVLPVLSVVERLTYARRGIELSEQLFEKTGQDRY